LHVAQRFERSLDTYRRPDGQRWSGQAIDEATDGIVTRSYITNLRKGRIENPGYEKESRIFQLALDLSLCVPRLARLVYDNLTGCDLRWVRHQGR
jgi:hypothetical protein